MRGARLIRAWVRKVRSAVPPLDTVGVRVKRAGTLPATLHAGSRGGGCRLYQHFPFRDNPARACLSDACADPGSSAYTHPYCVILKEELVLPKTPPPTDELWTMATSV